MANRKLSIGCVLIMGGALTNCGGTVDTHTDGGSESGAAGSGFVGVPPNGGFTGAVGTQVGAGSGPIPCCPGIPGTPGIGGSAHGGAPGVVAVGAGAGGYQVGAGAGGYGNEGGWIDGGASYGGEVGVPPYAGEGGVAGAGGDG
jgi:hypothetical protein